MKLIILVILALPTAQPAPIAGTWAGYSLCTVRDSPCRDEHVVYHIKADGSDPTKFTVDADKIVNGKEENMGALQCTFNPTKSELYCDTAGDWRFAVSGNTMRGTLNLKNGTLYRRVGVKKK